MGYNSTIVVMNDALHDIAMDEQFGKNLSTSISRFFLKSRLLDVPARGFANAATVIGVENSDTIVPYIIGGNTGSLVEKVYIRWNAGNQEEDLLKQLADKLGYNLVKKDDK